MLDKRLGTALRFYALKVVCAATFPRLAYWARWPTRVGWRGLLLYSAFNTAVGFAPRTWGVPYIKRRFDQLADQLEPVREDLRRELGREPSDDEVHKRFVASLRGES